LVLLAHAASSLIVPSSLKRSWSTKNNVRSSRLMPSTTAPKSKCLPTTVLHLRGGSTAAVNSLAGHMLIGAALGGVGDVFAQQSEATEGILTLKKKRFLGYLLFGTLVKGCCQHYLYGTVGGPCEASPSQLIFLVESNPSLFYGQITRFFYTTLVIINHLFARVLVAFSWVELGAVRCRSVRVGAAGILPTILHHRRRHPRDNASQIGLFLLQHV